jgi:hypothetical protein
MDGNPATPGTRKTKMATKPTTEVSHEYERSEQNSTESDSINQIATDSQNRLRQLINSASKTVLGLSIPMALVVGGLCAWALLGMGLGLIGFLAGGALTWYHLMQRKNGWLVMGRGLHLSAGITFFLPLLFYIPSLFASAGSETMAGAGTFVGSFLGIILWGIVFGFLAVFLGVVGYLFNRKGKAAVAQ